MIAPIRVLYLSYDGLLEPLGESQVVSYLEILARDHRITVASWEKPADLANGARLDAMKQRLEKAGVEWVRFEYRKSPPVISTIRDVRDGLRKLKSRAGEFDLIHARSYVASLIALGLLKRTHAKYIFDMRGFWVDEKVEGGHWKAGGLLYRVGKWWESRFLRAADAIVSLTVAGVETLHEGGFPVRPQTPMVVIPTCVDTSRFQPAQRDAELATTLDLGAGPVLGCVGTVSNWYMREEMLEFLAVATRHDPEAMVLFVTRDDHRILRRDAVAAGIPESRLRITASTFEDMPRYFSLIDVGVFFIRPTFAKRGSAATKMAEFLATGTPVVINGGVGDSGRIVREHDVGMVLDDLGQRSFESAVDALRSVHTNPEVKQRARATAVRLFDLNAGCDRYSEVYRALTERRDRQES